MVETDLSSDYFDPVLKTLNELEREKSLSLFEWADSFYNELHQSAAIGWLLDPQASHGKAKLFQESFLCYIRDHAIPFSEDFSDTKEEEKGKNGVEKAEEYKKRLESLISALRNDGSLKCSMEKTIPNYGRADIFLEDSKDSKNFLHIENKPFANEGNKQLTSYAQNAQKEEGIVLFLCNAKANSIDKDDELINYCARLDYESLSAWLLECSDRLLEEGWLRNNSTMKDLKNRLGLVSYIDHLSNLLTEENRMTLNLTQEQKDTLIKNWDALEKANKAKVELLKELLKEFEIKIEQRLNEKGSEAELNTSDSLWKIEPDENGKTISNRYYGFNMVYKNKLRIRLEFDGVNLTRTFYGLWSDDYLKNKEDDYSTAEIVLPKGQAKLFDFATYCKKDEYFATFKSTQKWPIWKYADEPKDWDKPSELRDDGNIEELVDFAKKIREKYENYNPQESSGSEQ